MLLDGNDDLLGCCNHCSSVSLQGSVIIEVECTESLPSESRCVPVCTQGHGKYLRPVAKHLSKCTSMSMKNLGVHLCVPKMRRVPEIG